MVWTVKGYTSTDVGEQVEKVVLWGRGNKLRLPA